MIYIRFLEDYSILIDPYLFEHSVHFHSLLFLDHESCFLIAEAHYFSAFVRTSSNLVSLTLTKFLFLHHQGQHVRALRRPRISLIAEVKVLHLHGLLLL